MTREVACDSPAGFEVFIERRPMEAGGVSGVAEFGNTVGFTIVIP